jgi:hypothetical protein
MPNIVDPAAKRYVLAVRRLYESLEQAMKLAYFRPDRTVSDLLEHKYRDLLGELDQCAKCLGVEPKNCEHFEKELV